MTSEKRTVSVGCDVPSVVNSLKACRSWIVRVCLPSAYNYMLIISVMLYYHLSVCSSASLQLCFHVLWYFAMCLSFCLFPQFSRMFLGFLQFFFSSVSHVSCFPLSSSTKFNSRESGLVQNPPQIVFF